MKFLVKNSEIQTLLRVLKSSCNVYLRHIVLEFYRKVFIHKIREFFINVHQKELSKCCVFSLTALILASNLSFDILISILILCTIILKGISKVYFLDLPILYLEFQLRIAQEGIPKPLCLTKLSTNPYSVLLKRY